MANINVFNTVYLFGAVDWETKLGGGEAWAIQPIPLEAGDYEVIPYLLIQQDGLPEELFLSISEYYDTFTAEYLKLPLSFSPFTSIDLNLSSNILNSGDVNEMYGNIISFTFTVSR